MNKELLKEVILSNEEYICKAIGSIIKREGIILPESLNKVVKYY